MPVKDEVCPNCERTGNFAWAGKNTLKCENCGFELRINEIATEPQDESNRLWRFVGDELNLDIPAKVIVKDLNEGEFERFWKEVVTAECNEELSETEKTEYDKERRWEAHEGEHDANKDLENLKKELNGQVFCREVVEKCDAYALSLLEKAFPDFKENDVLILIRTNNLPKRQSQWSTPNFPLTIDDVRLYLIIHEMVDAYSRLTKTKFNRDLMGDKKYDAEASRIFRKWRSLFRSF